EQNLSSNKGPQWMRDQEFDRFRRCSGTINADPFASLPAPSGEYASPHYWFDMAVKDGDPLAAADRAVQDLAAVGFEKSPELKAATTQRVQEVFASAVGSGDPAAIFRVGVALISGNAAADRVNAAAVTLAACNLGYDCSANNPDNPFSNCRLSGACPAD